jgi:hypothetical protein
MKDFPSLGFFIQLEKATVLQQIKDALGDCHFALAA